MSSSTRISLQNVRAAGWLDRLKDQSPGMEKLCEVMGEPFVGFSVVAGVTIRSLMLNAQLPSASVIEFTSGGSEESQEIPMGVLQRQLCYALLAIEDKSFELSAEEVNDPTAIGEAIGVRYLLLAELFEFHLKELRVAQGVEPVVVFSAGGANEELGLKGFRELLRTNIRGELYELEREESVNIDFKVLDNAKEAKEAGDPDAVIALLAPWQGSLMMMLRTQAGQTLDEASRFKIVEALSWLSDAQIEKSQFVGAEESIRLGIQWGKGGPECAPLFLGMARLQIERGDNGQAIGTLRRALTLGSTKIDVLPRLAHCYSARGRWVAAALCAEEFLEIDGADAKLVEDTLAKARQKLGDGWKRFRELS